MAEALVIHGGVTDRPSILVVDDTPAILQLLQVLLCDDYAIVTVDSGLRAVEAFAGKTFDLVLLDLLMPEIDGFETLKRLKQLPNFASTPVIFLTAMDDLASERCALELGADEYIVKPFKPTLVRLRIDNLLQRVHLQRQLEMALASADKGLWEWDLRSGRVSIDARWGEHLRLVPNQTSGDPVRWKDYCHPGCMTVIDEAKAAYLAGRLPAFDADVQLLNADGQWVWVNLYGKAVMTSAEGDFARLTGTYRNIERRKQVEIALQKSEERFRFVMDATGEGIWDWQVSSDLLAHNASFSRILGMAEGNLEHAVSFIQSLIHPDDLASVMGCMAACLDEGMDFVSEHRMRHVDGHYVWVAERGRVVERGDAGQPLRAVGSLRDISERKAIEAEYKRLALYDALTGLPNRRLLVDRLRQAIIQNRRNKECGVLMFIDMDRFKQINDTFGHESGDMLLIEVGRRLSSCMRETDTVARLGGDEFIVMLTELPDERRVARYDAERVGNKILDVLNQPYQLGGNVCESTPSIGLTLFGGDATEPVEAIIKRADGAMYEAKMAGRNRLRFVT
ncbi:two-component system response regulator [Quatrionicoccus australiensis]|uniref:two-component system response regulator n=1 Tax=Quatrionicoccus australiensis TaxID=138118 RepID=UPI001CFB24F9|nr:diguanylate cyclase [Quatrionicoccus australiensis]MCB4360470.1 diguanylate cyclase [Quatrionicoccus australiensis]